MFHIALLFEISHVILNHGEFDTLLTPDSLLSIKSFLLLILLELFSLLDIHDFGFAQIIVVLGCLLLELQAVQALLLELLVLILDTLDLVILQFLL